MTSSYPDAKHVAIATASVVGSALVFVGLRKLSSLYLTKETDSVRLPSWMTPQLYFSKRFEEQKKIDLSPQKKSLNQQSSPICRMYKAGQVYYGMDSTMAQRLWAEQSDFLLIICSDATAVRLAEQVKGNVHVAFVTLPIICIDRELVRNVVPEEWVNHFVPVATESQKTVVETTSNTESNMPHLTTTCVLQVHSVRYDVQNKQWTHAKIYDFGWNPNNTPSNVSQHLAIACQFASSSGIDCLEQSLDDKFAQVADLPKEHK